MPVVPTVTSIVNRSMNDGVFQTALKHALVKPLFKKSQLDPEVLKNYHPVSNLDLLAKIIEKTISTHLAVHMNDSNLHEKMQSAYKPNHSTETALIRVQNDILYNIDSKQCVFAGFRHLQK